MEIDESSTANFTGGQLVDHIGTPKTSDKGDNPVSPKTPSAQPGWWLAGRYSRADRRFQALLQPVAKSLALYRERPGGKRFRGRRLIGPRRSRYGDLQ
jgi:hypothetical protein